MYVDIWIISWERYRYTIKQFCENTGCAWQGLSEFDKNRPDAITFTKRVWNCTT